MWTTQDEFGGSESEEDLENEEVVLCFMGIEENEQEGNEHELEENNTSYDDVVCAFEELYGEMKKI